MTEPTRRPDYIRIGGNVMMQSPLALKQSQMYGFFVRGERGKLQSTVDATLNAPAAGRMRFKVLSPYVMLTFTRVGHANSTVPQFRDEGWGTETDIVTWVLVGEVLPGESKVHRIFSYPVHIWVDDCMALINGRELYGYPKYLCEYTMPAPGQPPEHFTIAAKGFQPYAPDTQMAMHPLLEVNATQPPSPNPLVNLEHLAKEAIQVLSSDLDALDLDLAGWEQVLQAVIAPSVDQIFLKQFPDGSGEKAVYQAVVAAPATVKQVHQVEFLGGEYACTLHPYASFPLNETLGLKLGDQPAILPFHVFFDFEVGAARELVDNSTIAPKKVAVLGGGVGAITAAYYLSDQPGWQDRYDITVYQMGWRIGGKGASGRNAKYGGRIEEHGLHIWFGFYENAFKMMREAYAAMHRPPGAPLATWDEAFKPQHFISLTEHVDGEWKVWPLDTPIKPGVPGDGSEDVTLWDMITTLYEWIRLWLHELHDELDRLPHPPAPPSNGGWLRKMADAAGHAAHEVAHDMRKAVTAMQHFAAQLGTHEARRTPEHHALMKHSLIELREWLHDAAAPHTGTSDVLRRMFICLDLSWTILIGLIEDGVLEHGFDVINDIDLRDWLAKHGANKKVTVDSAPIVGLYDLVFAYEDGDFSKPNLEAGTMLRGMFRIGFAYQGGVMWKMQAGMGDVVFSPLYEVLKQRGVKFRFFHKVEELLPAEDGSNEVGSIRLVQQVALKDGPESYRPLVDVKGLPCWPSAPEYSQIVPQQAALLQAHRINLESNWTDWPEVYRQAFGQPLPELTLQRGKDFDIVVFGISAAGVPQVCPQLVERNEPLKRMCEKVKTVATQSYQVWLDKSVRQTGWKWFAPDGQEPVLSSFSEPFDTWAPMDQLLVREAWPPQCQPKNVSYFCSALPMAHYPPTTDHAFPKLCAETVKANAIGQLQDQIHVLWPRIAKPGEFDWNTLVDLDGGTGVQRFDSQYWRANVDPSERYVLSVVGSTAYRLNTDGSGFSNLYLAGDWVKTGINAGCVEAGVMSGMLASRAISGWPQVIKGEKDIV
jgi:uncharacterized protein with NAD-binding domain and iron-sulfur cluster